MFIQILLLAILLVGSAFFSGAETALFALSRHELYRFQHDPRASRRLVAALMHRPRHLLLTLMIGNVTINMFIFAASLTLFQKLAGPGSVWAPVLGLTSPILVTLFGEIFPKGTAIALRTHIAPHAAPLVKLCQLALAPVTWLLNTLLVAPMTRLLTGPRQPVHEVKVEELRELVAMSEQRKIIDADENAMLSGAIQLDQVKVRNIMIPRVDMLAFDIHGRRDNLRQLMREKRLPKIPVYDTDIDNILGLIYAKDLYLSPDKPLRQLIRPVLFVPDVLTLTQLIRHFRRTATALAMVVDEYGGLLGLVTIEDVAEEIVGELCLPGDAETLPTWERLDDHNYRVSGSLNIRDWSELFHVRTFDERVSTLGGLVLAQLGRLPRVGDEVRLVNCLLTVESLRNRRIEWIHLRLIEPGQGSSESASSDATKGGNR